MPGFEGEQLVQFAIAGGEAIGLFAGAEGKPQF
jgi:hypothetical protein